MNTKTLKALKGSIQKWKKIVDGTGGDKGQENCPLCQLFIDNGCVDCPIEKDWACSKEYNKWVQYFQDHKSEDFKKQVNTDKWKLKVFDEKSLKLAEKMLKSLEALLPKKRQQKSKGKK